MVLLKATTRKCKNLNTQAPFDSVQHSTLTFVNLNICTSESLTESRSISRSVCPKRKTLNSAPKFIFNSILQNILWKSAAVIHLIYLISLWRQTAQLVARKTTRNSIQYNTITMYILFALWALDGRQVVRCTPDTSELFVQNTTNVVYFSETQK